MNAYLSQPNNTQYARAVASSKRARWEIDADVIRGRSFLSSEKLLPDGLTLAKELTLLDEADRVLFSQVQGRTYANIFGLVERYINAKVLSLSERHLFGDQTALEALVRFSDEELKHQELFRRIEALAAQVMPPGYSFAHDPNAVARVVLSKSTWSVLALTCLIELFTLVHYKDSIEPDELLSPLFKDVFRFHWMEESQHAVIDELEWLAEDARIDPAAREQAVSDLILLVAAVDGILQAQSKADSAYFIANAVGTYSTMDRAAIQAAFLRAYRHQYIHSGVRRTRFPNTLQSLIPKAQFERIVHALSTLT